MIMKKIFELTTTENILEKLKLRLGIKKGMELAEAFNVKANTLSSWKMRNSIPYERILRLCEQYQLDLNEIFYDNYHTFNVKEDLKEIPLLYLTNHWEYYFNPTFQWNNLPQVYFPQHVDFDIIIQLPKANIIKLESKLSFYFCKKVEGSNLVLNQPYIMIIKDKGFVHSELVHLDPTANHLVLKLTPTSKLKVAAKDVIEIFHCKGLYHPIQ